MDACIDAHALLFCGSLVEVFPWLAAGWEEGGGVQGIRSDVSAVLLTARKGCCRFDGGTFVPK